MTEMAWEDGSTDAPQTHPSLYSAGPGARSTSAGRVTHLSRLRLDGERPLWFAECG
jgi:hypothetical protein